MKRDRKYIAVLLAMVGAAAYLLVSTSAGSGSSWPFTDVTASQLAGQGVTLTPGTAPAGLAVSATEAAAAASTFQGGRSPLVGAQYMHCVDTTRVPAIDQDCWVVSIDASGMFAPGGILMPSSTGSSAGIPLHFDIVFVDPTSGQPIEATLG